LRSPTWTGRNPPAQVLRWILLSDEFRLYALRNPSARRHLARHEQHLRDSYALAARQFLDPLGLRDAVPASVVGALLFALDHDLNRQQIIDPSHVPATSFADAVAILIDAMVALAAASSPAD